MAKETACPISVRVTKEEKEALIKYAEKHDLTMSQVIRKALKEFLQDEEIKDNKN